MLKNFFFLSLTLILASCGSGLCPLGNSYRTNCPIGGSQSLGAIGVLDTSFNSTGMVITPIGAAHDFAYSLALQTDGKILLGGQVYFAGISDFGIVRYNIDGSLDTTFNTTGYVTTPIGVFHDNGQVVALQPDGKILMGGNASIAGNMDFAIVRYNSNGSLDTSFNTTGFVTTAIGAASDYIQSLVVQPDGKIVAGGYIDVGGPSYDFAIARYNSNGSLDTSFNTTGFVTTAIGVASDYGQSLALQPDGKILLGGFATIGANDDFAIARYNSNGSLDTSFNTTGIVTRAIGVSHDRGYSLVLQPDGKILLGGRATIGGNYDFVVARFLSNGSIDTSFNTSGYVTTAIGPTDDYGQTLALQSDGKILLGGNATIGGNFDFAVVRYNSTGSLDTTFNTTGFVTSPIGLANDNGYSLALQPDGKILLGGSIAVGAEYDFGIARYR